jgi:hypothetical protein
MVTKLHDILYLGFFNLKKEYMEFATISKALLGYAKIAFFAKPFVKLPFPTTMVWLFFRKSKQLFFRPVIILFIVFVFRPFIRYTVTPLCLPYATIVYLWYINLGLEPLQVTWFLIF